MLADLTDKLISAVVVAVGVSVPIGVAVKLLKDLFNQNTKAITQLTTQLNDIQITYPQTFVKTADLTPRCTKNEDMLYKHDGQIKVINSHLKINN